MCDYHNVITVYFVTCENSEIRGHCAFGGLDKTDRSLNGDRGGPVEEPATYHVGLWLQH